MKDIRTIKIKDVDYAVGLEWDILENVPNKDLINRLSTKAKSKGKDYGCVIKKDNGTFEVGFAKQNVKGMPALAAILSKELKEVLFVKKINNIDNWVCNLDSRGLIVDQKEGVFSDKDLFDLIDDLSILGQISIVCSKEDYESLFKEDFSNLTFTHIDLEDIIDRNKKISDDVITTIVKKSQLKRNILTAIVLGTIASGSGYYLLTDSQEYIDIINQEHSIPLDSKDKKFKKLIKDNQVKLASRLSMNAGKKLLLEKVNTNIYTKSEIFSHIKELYENYPLYFYEWELDNIQYVKSEDNKDVKFSVVYKRIEESIGYYDEIKEKSLELANKNFKLYNVIAYPGDLGNDIIIIDHYFKQPLKLKDESDDEEALAKLEKEIKVAERDIKRIRDVIGEIEYKVSGELSFIDKKFGSAVSEASEEIDSNVTKALKIYDVIIKKYENQDQSDIVVPEEYTNGSKINLLNMAQKNSYYQWRDDKQAILLPIEPVEKEKQLNYKAFAKVWKFNLNSKDYSTQGVSSIERAVDILSGSDISIYNVNYRIENESWYLKGEMYEKN